MPVSLCLNAIKETSPFKSDPDFHLHIVKTGEIWGRNQNDKNG